MDYRLRRQPDGTVNAQPGDAVEVWVELTTAPQWYRGIITKTYMYQVKITLDNGVRLCVDYAHVRHARGGAGWHRLREARLLEALERVLNDTDMLHEEYHWQWLAEAIADLDTEDADNAEPEA